MWVGMINLTFVLRSPKEGCYGNQLNLGTIRRRRHEGPLLFALAFDNGLDDRDAAFKRLNGNNTSTSCTNLVSFHRNISEITLLKLVIFAATRPQFDDRPSFAHWRSETDWNIVMSITTRVECAIFAANWPHLADTTLNGTLRSKMNCRTSISI